MPVAESRRRYVQPGRFGETGRVWSCRRSRWPRVDARRSGAARHVISATAPLSDTPRRLSSASRPGAALSARSVSAVVRRVLRRRRAAVRCQHAPATMRRGRSVSSVVDVSLGAKPMTAAAAITQATITHMGCLTTRRPRAANTGPRLTAERADRHWRSGCCHDRAAAAGVSPWSRVRVHDAAADLAEHPRTAVKLCLTLHCRQTGPTSGGPRRVGGRRGGAGVVRAPPRLVNGWSGTASGRA